MKQSEFMSGCACHCCNISRRHFIAAGGLAAVTTFFPIHESAAASLPEGKKKRIRLVYVLHDPIQVRPTWPHAGYDHHPNMERYLSELKKVLPTAEIVTSIVNDEASAKRVVAEDGDRVQGYVVVQMNNWIPVISFFANTGKPTLHSDCSYNGSGGFLVYCAGVLRKNPTNFSYVSSTDFRDLLEAVKCFETISSPQEFRDAVAKVRKVRTKPYNTNLKIVEDDLGCLSTQEIVDKLKSIKIIAIDAKGEQEIIGKTALETLGIETIRLKHADLDDIWNETMKNTDEIQQWVSSWKKGAVSIASDIADETLAKSAAMYLAQLKMLEKYNAMAISIDCLGGFYSGKLNAYPCLGFTELNNRSLIGGCECDLKAAITMAILTIMTKGRPGYISDPVVDTSTRQIVYAHCVAPTKMFGPNGPENSYEILSHSEDRKGAAVRSIAPAGYMTSTMKFCPPSKRVVFHQAITVGNSSEDRACRTKICAEVPGDMEKLLREWDQWGWHRVTVYGDVKKQVFDLAKAIGYTVVEEA